MAQVERIRGSEKLAAAIVISDIRSVAKELVDNACDAGATRILVSLKNNGLDEISVEDNGSGIDLDGLLILGQHGVTSKIDNYNDVAEIQTHGFRGEALHSIAQVSESVSVTSCTGDDGLGYEIQLGRGNPSPANRTRGTTVTVLKPLSRLTVRYKVAQQAGPAQLASVISLLQRQALGHPSLDVTCVHMGKGAQTVKLSARSVPCSTPVPEESVLRQRWAQCFGSAAGMSFFRFDVPHGNGTDRAVLSGLVSAKTTVSKAILNLAPRTDRSSDDRQFFFLQGGRPIRLPLIARAISHAYRAVCSFRHPCFVVFLECNPQLIDINVDTDKQTALIHDEQGLAHAFGREFSQFFSDSETQQHSDAPLPATTRVVSQSDDTMTPEPTLQTHFKPVKDENGSMSGFCLSSSPIPSVSGPEQPLHFWQQPNYQSNQQQLSRIPTTQPMPNPPAARPPPSYNDFSRYMKSSTDTPQPVTQRPPAVDPLPLTAQPLPAPPPAPYAPSPASPPLPIADTMDDVPSLVLRPSHFSSATLIGQFNHSFIMIIVEGHIVVLDQHAAHEAIRFESLVGGLSKAISTQNLLAPVQIQCSPEAIVAAGEHITRLGSRSAFAQMGIRCEVSGDHLYMLSASTLYGMTLGADDVAEMAENIAAAGHTATLCGVPLEGGLTGDTYAVSSLTGICPPAVGKGVEPSRVRNRIASRACRSAVMFGQPLTYPQMGRILQELSQCSWPWHCPHGRPVARLLGCTIVQ